MDYRSIYEEHAVEYDTLVRAEDADNNLSAALSAIEPLSGKRFVEIGAGTGRVTRLLADAGSEVLATEPAAAMIDLAGRSLRDLPGLWLCRAEAAALPFPDQCFDGAIAGWVLGHQREWAPDNWRERVDEALTEMSRVLDPGGTTILIETLGTGATGPSPSAELAEYYAWLENVRGFESTWIRTDYVFASVEEAATVTGFFFGDAFAKRVRDEGWMRVPECTGIWWQT